MHSVGGADHTRARFETTNWSLVHRLHDKSDAERARANQELARIYWPPVYAFLRGRGVRAEDAAEATQAFFADVVIGRDLFDRADEQRGRLRAWVLAALKRFVIDRARYVQARAGRAMHVPIDEEIVERLADHADPDAESSFERAWAIAAVQEATRRCEAHFKARGKHGHWQVFESRVLRPICASVAAPLLSSTNIQNGFHTPADAAAAVQAVKKALIEHLRAVAAESVSTGHDADSEYLRIRTLLGV